MEDKKYNGWTNYATWRVQLELISDYVSSVITDIDTDELVADFTAESLEEYAEEAITNFGEIAEDSLAVSYANAFLSDVNWYELAETANEDLARAKKEAVK